MDGFHDGLCVGSLRGGSGRNTFSTASTVASSFISRVGPIGLASVEDLLAERGGSDLLSGPYIIRSQIECVPPSII